MIGLLMLVAASGGTVRSYFTGNSLESICQSDRNACEAYVAGIIDGTASLMQVLKAGQLICEPNGGTLPQSTDVVVKYLRDHPETRHEAAAQLVSVALVQAFPCGKSG